MIPAGGVDTIVAPATPVGRSALAMVRIDGPASTFILTSLGGASVPDVRRATLLELWHGGEQLDRCIAIRYEAPASFTGNDLVELTLHGNPLLVERLVSACLALGARLAEPGEFTERAVLNGKMDLVQAESIADLINARTSLQAKLSLSNLEGMLSRKARAVRDALLHVISRLEAALDFSEEGYEFITRPEAHRILQEAIRDMVTMAETYRRGRATADGLSAVILGRPNAGKSTLLNRLVGSDRAIVTPIPGTTRDIVRETIEVGGLPVTFADTAGLRDSDDLVEGIGIERAREAARSADIILYLVDATVGLTDEDRREIGDLDILLIYTKADLVPARPWAAASAADPIGIRAISAVTDEGVNELLSHLDELVRVRFAAPEGGLMNERQMQMVMACRAALLKAAESLEQGLEEQIVVVDLHRAASSISSLVGDVTRDDVLAEIFGKFCIGK